MELTKKEKEKIFWVLVNDYPSYQKSKNQAKLLRDLGGDVGNFKKIIRNIEESEIEHYKLMLKLSKEINIKMSEKVKC